MSNNKPAVVYSNVWEDPELNRLSLKVNPGENVLSITSGGCNSLCLLLEDPAKLISIDLNPAQLSMLELKRAAIMELEYDDFIEVLGVPFFRKPSDKPSSYRIELYNKIKKCMPQYATDFWDDNQNLIKDGIMMCGKVEKFFAIYRKALSFLYDEKTLLSLFEAKDLQEQREVYKEFRKKRWNALHRLLLNRFILSLVKGAHSFAQVDFEDFAGNLNRKRTLGMMRFFNPDNYFMSLILLGGHYHEKGMSPYLLRENFPKLKQNIDRLEIFQGTIGQVLEKDGPGSYDKFNLSNIFEWMTNEVFNDIIREVLGLARPGSRMAWRYTLARPRDLDGENLERLEYEKELSDQLFKQDRAFIYESFHVYNLRR
jgi:S-adenosylmethionine-diacylglycerol 3-amino-3-carboxypropyl transferase